MKARRVSKWDLRNAPYNRVRALLQPLVNLEYQRDHLVRSAAALASSQRGTHLARRVHPDRRETGLIIPVGNGCCGRPAWRPAKWRRTSRSAVKLISPAQLKASNVVEVVMSALEESGLPAIGLQLEITESVLHAHTFGTLATLHKLRELGVQIANGRLRTGYSSLSYLRSFRSTRSRSTARSFRTFRARGAARHRAPVAGLAKCSTWSRPRKASETQQQMETLQNVGAPRCGLLLQPRPSPRPRSSRTF